MIEEILASAGLPGKPARFPNPPSGPYAVFFDSVDADGPDGFNRIFTHHITIELYAPIAEQKVKSSLEKELNARGLHFTTQGWFWLGSVQRYQEIYEFDYITKN